jgi:hypothetical protein
MRIVSIIGLVLASYLTLAAQNGCIEGRVLDSAGAPITTHVVGVGSERQAGFDLGTDPDGYFRIDSIPAGDYDVATSDDYKTDFRHVSLATAKPASAVRATALQGDGCSSITLHLPVRGRLHLTLTDLLTSKVVPSPHGSFRYNPASAWMGLDDEGTLLVPPLSDLEVHVGARGYELSEPIKIPPLQPGEVRELKVSLRPTHTGCITGIVVDQVGAPLTDVEVRPSLNDFANELLSGAAPPVRSGADGRFTLKTLHPGNYILFTNAIALGYPMNVGGEGSSSLTVQPGAGCADITIKLGPKAGKLALSVLDAVTRKSPKDYVAWLNAETWSLRVVVNPMPVPAFKEMRLSVRASGYQLRTVTLSPLQPDEKRTLTIELEPARPGTAQ